MSYSVIMNSEIYTHVNNIKGCRLQIILCTCDTVETFVLLHCMFTEEGTSWERSVIH